MTKELRATRISTLGDIPWGTHFRFYETKEALLDILAPHFSAHTEAGSYLGCVAALP